MRMIDVNTLLKAINNLKAETDMYEHDGVREICVNQLNRVMAEILKCKYVDAEPVVRCGECKYLKQNRVIGSHWCDRRADKVIVIPDDYCSFGERDEK